MASAWYSPKQALLLSLLFTILDLTVNIFGLAWNGSFFTFANIQHWFDFRYYNFTLNPVDFLAVAVLRVCLLLGGAIGVYFNSRGGAEACAKFSNATFALLLVAIAFSPIKLLAFYEHDDLKLAVGDWILMIWCIVASLAVQAIWSSIFTRVRDSLHSRQPRLGHAHAGSARGNSSNFHYRRMEEEEVGVDGEHNPHSSSSNGEEYFESVERREEEEAATHKETFALLARLFSYMAKEWFYYTICFSFLFLYSLTRIFVPYLTGTVVGSVFSSGAAYAELHKCVAWMAILSFSSAVFGGFRGGFFTYAQARIDRRIRHDLFRALVHQEIGFFDETKTGELCSRLAADCQTMSNTLSLYMNVFTRNLTMLVGSLIFMVTLSWQLTTVTLIAVPIIFLISKVFGVFYDSLSEQIQTSIARANDVAEEVLSAIRTVKSFACERYEAARFLRFLDITLALGTKKALAHIGFLISTELMQMGILTAVLFYGGHLVIQGRISTGLLVSFLLYQFQLGDNIRELGEVWNALMQAVGASRKVFELIDRQPKVVNERQLRLSGTDGRGENDGGGERGATSAGKKLEGRLEFRNVRFSYPTRPDVPVLQDLSFVVEPGEVVALVGPSGGGKSSCIALLEHFYEPESGDVLLDGVPVRDYSHTFLHTAIALVGQEPVLYARSVRENIAYGYGANKHHHNGDDDDNERDENNGRAMIDEAVEQAARHANAHAFIMETQDGYGTDVGEKGSRMSGGQKQRIAIARALVRNPAVLLLDEATSALDTESERLVQEAIQKNLRGRTVLLIAHRLSTVESADKIVVIAGGRVAQIGTHASLIQQEGIYKQLVQRQMLAPGARGGEGNGQEEEDNGPSDAEARQSAAVEARREARGLPPSRRIQQQHRSTSPATQSPAALPGIFSPAAAHSFLGSSIASSSYL